MPAITVLRDFTLLSAVMVNGCLGAQSEVRGGEMPPYWRTRANAPVNALYLLLSAHGKSVGFRETVQAFAGTRSVNSLQDVCDAADALGVLASIRRTSLADLWRADEPVIAYIDGSEEDLGESGHLLVLTEFQRESKSLVAYDALSAVGIRVPCEVFNRDWSGFVLQLDQRDDWLGRLSETMLAIAVGWIARRLAVRAPRKKVSNA